MKQLEEARQQQQQQNQSILNKPSPSPPPSTNKQRTVYDDLEESGLSKAKQTALILRSAFSKTSSKSWSTAANSSSATPTAATATNQRSNSIDEETTSSSPKSVSQQQQSSKAPCKMIIVNVDATNGKLLLSGERLVVSKLIPELAELSDESIKYLNKSSVDMSLVEVMERLYSSEFVLEALHSNEYIFKSNKF